MKLYPPGLYNSAAKNSEAQPMVEMNTTPLIDVLLVLIVMLIITIPAQLHAVALDMPSKAKQAQPTLIRVQIDANGFVRWNGELISEVTTLDTRLKDAAAQATQPEIHITPESNTPYSLVVSMTALAQKVGLRQVGVVN